MQDIRKSGKKSMRKKVLSEELGEKILKAAEEFKNRNR